MNGSSLPQDNKGLTRAAVRSLLLSAIALLCLASAVGFFLFATAPSSTPIITGISNDGELLERLKSTRQEDLIKLESVQIQNFFVEPLDRDTLKNLVVLNELKKKEGGNFYDVVSRFTKRNIAVELGALGAALQARDFPKAMFHLDSLLRAHPELGKTVYPLIYPAFAEEKAVTALATVLVAKPKWRTDFLNELAEYDATSNLSYGLFAAIRKQNAAVADSEFRTLFSNLISKNQFDKAYFMWLDFLPSADLADLKLLFDGSFEKVPRNLFFDWNLLKRPNARIAIANRNDQRNNKMLRLEFFQDKGEFYHVYQYLNLPAGRYSLSFESMLENTKMAAGLQWRIRCASDDSIKGQSARLNETAPWTDQKFLFTVPNDGCATQILRLESSSAAELDRKYDGQMSFDNFAIEKIASEEDEPPSETVQP